MLSVSNKVGKEEQTAQLGMNLRELVQHRLVNHVRVFSSLDTEPQCESAQWSFDDTFMRVGDQVYCMRQLVRFEINDQTLTLHM